MCKRKIKTEYCWSCSLISEAIIAIGVALVLHKILDLALVLPSFQRVFVLQSHCGLGPCLALFCNKSVSVLVLVLHTRY